MRRGLFVPAIVCAAVLTLFVQAGAVIQYQDCPELGRLTELARQSQTAADSGRVLALIATDRGDSTCCRYVGDINHDGAACGVVDIADLVYLVTYMFQGGQCDRMCEETGIEDCMHWELDPYFPEADINGDGYGVPLIDDLVWLVSYMF